MLSICSCCSKKTACTRLECYRHLYKLCMHNPAPRNGGPIPAWTPVGTSYRPISYRPAAEVLESLILPTINKYLQPAPDQHGFIQEYSTTSGLLQMTTYIAMRFNQRKPPDRTICLAVDLSAAFDTVCHNNLLSKINRSQLPRPQRDGCHVI